MARVGSKSKDYQKETNLCTYMYICTYEYVYARLKKFKLGYISMKPNSNLNHFKLLLFHTIPPPLDQYNLFRSYKNGRPL